MPRTNRTWLTTAEAARRAEVHPCNLPAWCERYGLGRKVAGRWRVDPDKLAALLAGKAREVVNHAE